MIDDDEMALSAEETRSDIHLLKVDIQRLRDNNIASSSYLLSLEKRYKNYFKRKIKQKNRKDNVFVVDENGLKIINNDDLYDLIDPTLKPAR